MPNRLNKEEFIEKAIKIHGNKYDYSGVKYIHSKKDISIICTKHGNFEQTPNTHLRGGGCKKCGRIICADKIKSNTNDFIEKAIKIHGNKYDYSEVDYIRCSKKVTIICTKHGNFEQRPNDHLTGNGCMNCCLNKKKTLDEFVEHAIKIHGNKYDYSEVEYITSCDEIVIGCLVHGKFNQTPTNHLHGGCSKCAYINSGIQQRKNQNDVIDNFIKIHGNKYDYSSVKYTTIHDKIIIGCFDHGNFEQTPKNHLSGRGCIKCGILTSIQASTYTHEDFIEKAIKIHGNKYDYSEVKYIGCRESINVICKKHGSYETLPYLHLQNHNCPKCNIRHSKISIQWLKYMEFCHNNNIQHAENIKEYFIPSTLYHADGFCKETKTIYEFHGDLWHGNPKIYNSLDINPISKISYGELYNKTITKKQKCIELGYNYVEIWEHDWKKIIKVITKLQRLYRNNKSKQFIII